jgi:hypothetical protein
MKKKEKQLETQRKTLRQKEKEELFKDFLKPEDIKKRSKKFE